MELFFSFRFYFCPILFLTISLIQFSLQKASEVEKVDCNPVGDPNQDQYIVGYGSLVKTAPKNKTNLPVLITGYSRVWNCKGVSSSLSTTYLGIVPNSNETFNGVIFNIPRDALDDYDERELYYCREAVKNDLVSILVPSNHSQAEVPLGQYWVYVTKPQYTAFPSEDYPIVQSYVDTFLSGCLEIQSTHNLSNFAEDCIKTTEGWEHPWINDRIYPRRPFVHEPNAGKIDKLISKLLPTQFKGIKVQ